MERATGRFTSLLDYVRSHLGKRHSVAALFSRNELMTLT
jgi:hypothetical protein